jgi:hypothetical protein
MISILKKLPYLGACFLAWSVSVLKFHLDSTALSPS